jgi:hypothetical protein
MAHSPAARTARQHVAYSRQRAWSQSENGHELVSPQSRSALSPGTATTRSSFGDIAKLEGAAMLGKRGQIESRLTSPR